VELEVLLRRENDARHLADLKHVRAVAQQLGAHVAVGTVYQRDDHDDGSHAHDHADEREDGAQFVGPQRLQSEFDGLGELHSPAFYRDQALASGDTAPSDWLVYPLREEG
jgi:hypothetical protein